MNSSAPSTHRSLWTPHPASPWIALVATLLLLAFLEIRRLPPEPVSADAAPEVFSAERAFDALQTILDADASGGIEIHPTGSDAAHRVRDRIVDELIARGVPADAVEIHETVACRDSARWSYVGCTPVRNVVATLPGPTDGPALVLMSHYDSVGAGPGVSDDAVGVAATLETVRALLAADPTGAHREHPVVVLVTDAEEVGLFGARGFVDRHPLATEGRVGAVLNLEARGTGGQSLLFQASEDDAWIVDAYRQAAQGATRPASSSLYAEVYRRLPNDTDLSVFLDAGIAGINFAYAEGVQRYHTPIDDLEHLDRGSLQHHGDHLLAMTRQLASDARLGDPPAGRAVYTDVASLFLLVYPVSWALPLALLALAGLLFLVVVAIRRAEASPKELLVGMLRLLLCTVVSVALAWLFGELVKPLAGTQRPGWAHPLPLRSGLWALVFLVPAILGWIPRRFPSLRFGWMRSGDAALTLASWLCLGLLAVVLAATVPGASVFATVPALVAVVLGALAAWRPSDRARNAARLGVALATAIFWFNIARGLEMGMGLHMTALVAAPLAIAAWPYAVDLRAESARRLRWALAAVVLVGFVGALRVSPYSATNPLGVNIVHFEDHAADGTVDAAIWVDSGADAPPDALRAVARLDALPEPAPDGLRLGTAYRSETGPEYLKPPRLEVLNSETIDGVRRIAFRMVGPEADFLRLYLPEAVDLRRVEVAGYDVDMAGKEIPGAHLLFCTGPDCDRVEFTVEVAGTDPVSGELYALRYDISRDSFQGLPPGARNIADARPDWAMPVHSGDRVAVRVGVSLP